MSGFNTGRNIQKYKGSSGTASTLQDALENGNTASLDIVLQSPAIFVGDGSGLTNIPGVGGSVGNLQQVTDVNATTTRFITLSNTVTSLQTSGSIIVGTNVHAVEYFGDGTKLSGIALNTELADNVIRIGNLETNLTNNSTRITTVTNNLTNNSTRITTVTNNLTNNVIRIGNLETNLTNNSTRIMTVTNNLTNNVIRINTLENEIQPVNRGGTNITSYTIGDLLYASGSNTLNKLSPGTSGQILTSSGPGSAPTWTTISSGGGGGGGGGVWTTGTGTEIYYDSGNVGISNTAPTNTLDIGSSVSISDSGSDTLIIRRGNTYIEKDLYVGGVITSPVGGSMKIDTMTVRSLNIKNMVVVAERPPKNININ